MLLDHLQETTISKENIDKEKLFRTLCNIEILWDNHKEDEEYFFKKFKREGFNIPFEAMFIEQHRQLKGHWKVLNKSLLHGDKNEIFTTLDTDGKMFVEKLKRHMDEEEKALKKVHVLIPMTNFKQRHF